MVKEGVVAIHYGTDGMVIVNSDGFVHGDRYALKKLAFVFGRKNVPFVTCKNGLLLNPGQLCC